MGERRNLCFQPALAGLERFIMSDFDDEMTPVQFTVVKYVPDLLRDEPMNVGIVARHSDGRSVLRTVPTFGKIRSLANGDSTALEVGLKFLRSALDRDPNLTLDDLTKSSNGIIRFSEPMGGLALDEEEFIDEQFEFYCSENVKSRVVRGSDRRQLRISIRKAMSTIGEDASRFEVYKNQVKGKTGGHDLDFAFKNGKVSLFRAISLQSNDAYILSEARTVSFAAVDTRELGYSVTAFVKMPEERNEKADEALTMIDANVDAIVTIGKDDLTAKLREIFGEGHDVKPLLSECLLQISA